MAYDVDPYRTLGLSRGASLDDVKRAYRRLAKINHPDAAGLGALPRFLAIQAAYEQLVEGAPGPGARPRGQDGAPRRPSEADPGRADATRRAYGGRARPRRGTDNAATGNGRPGRAAPDSREGGRGEPAGRSSGAGVGGPADAGAGRPRGKATLGSTSYDDANAGPFEPDWSGASWYGTTSGTYWTINPKEYADPRKHGPEYQARARRKGGREPDGIGTEPPPAGGASPGVDDDAKGGEPVSAAGAARATGATHTTSTWWDSTPRARDEGAEPRGTAGVRPASAPRWPPPDAGQIPDPAQALADLGRALTDPDAGGLRGRIIRAFVGWLPIALGIGWLLGELTGCGRFAATCDPAINPLILLIQGGALVLLLLGAIAASLAASAALSLLAAAVAATLVLSAAGGAADDASRRATLGLLLVIAWLAGLAIAIVRRLRSASTRAGPVS
jgi:DnaJ domain